MYKLFWAAIYLVIINYDCLSQELPIKATRTISFKTDEGSYINLDISPDGKTLLFDLLGDLYTLPVSGGTATQLTRGLALNLRPAWSPDGKKIAYFSDSFGAFHLHVRDINGGFQKILRQSDEALPYSRNAIWLNDGNHIAVDKIIYSLFDDKARSTIIGDLIRFSKDGNSFYYLDSQNIYRYDYTTKAKHLISPVDERLQYGDISPDGHWWAYITDSNNQQCLVVKDLINNTKKIIVPSLFKTSGYNAGVPSPRFCFTSDSKYLFIGYSGKIHRIQMIDGDDQIIPFLAHVRSDLGPLNYNTFRINYNPVKAKYTRSANTSPDGKHLVFSAFNKLYSMDLPSGKVKLLIDQPVSQYQPVYSPDGQWIAYVSWSDTAGGHLWRVRRTGGRPEQLTLTPGVYQHPCWSPDSKFIAVIVGKPEFGDRDNPGTGNLVLIPIDSLHTIRTIDEKIPLWNLLSFSNDGSQIIYQPPPPQATHVQGPWLISKNIQALDSQILAVGIRNNYLQQRTLSPDGRFIVYSSAEDLYLIPVISKKAPSIVYGKFQQVSAIRFASGIDPYWQKGGKVLCWSYGNRFYRVNTDKILLTAQKLHPTGKLANSIKRHDFIEAPVTPDQVINLEACVPTSFAHGTIVLQDVRIITMLSKKSIEHGTIIIKDGRIISVGPKANTIIPKKAKIFNLPGATVIPGLVDLHLHTRLPPDIFPQQSWMFLSSLAYGVTTARDPSLSFDSYGYKELLETGQMIGPRLYTVGRAVNPVMLMGLYNFADAKAIVHKRALLGGSVVKQYELPTRLQRQWLLMACRQAGLNMTNEGSQDPILVIAMLKDGSTGVEHNPMWGDVHKDIISFVAASQSWLTPALQVSYGTEAAKEYFNYTRWRQYDKKMNRFLDSSSWALKNILNAHPSDTINPGFLAPAAIDARILHAGGRIGMGSHGNDKGVGPHNEIWALQMGGLTNYEALRAATLTGAEALGVQRDLGSIEVGKIADLLILNKNPLDDIHNTSEIRYVMKDGILYDGDTLDEIWPEVKKCPEWKLKVPVKQP